MLILAEERREDFPHPKESVDLADTLNALLPAYQTQAREKNLDLDILISSDLPKIAGREKIVDDLFTNLISNALKYTPQGGRVAVTLSKGVAGNHPF